jgi:very-short-patch-repair endonuclease
MSNWFKSSSKNRASRAAKVAAATNNDSSDLFTIYCQSLLGREPVREFRFHPSRKWRFDYAFPDCKVAIECDGGVWTGGRHNRPQGYIRDMEKFNAAAELGWVVLKFTPQQLMTSATIETIRSTINQRSAL